MGALAAFAPQTASTAPHAGQYLTFRVAGEEYGVPVLSAREILEHQDLTPVPGTPAHVRGVLNLRGRVVPVIDLALRLGWPATVPSRRSCVVIVEGARDGERVAVGLLVDAVSEVVDVDPAQVEAPPPFGTHEGAFLCGLARTGRRFLLLLDLARVLALHEAVVPEEDAAPEAGSVVRQAALAMLLFLALLLAPEARAQEPISDNSFLIEEAYNQERGVVQHISTFSRSAASGDWLYTFTQEWPLPAEKHQLGFTLPVQDLHDARATGVGDLAVNYRYQALGGGDAALAVAPRASLLVPTGSASRGLGSGGVGLQVALPVSWALGHSLVTHWNAGVTQTLSARDAAGDRAKTRSYALGQGVVWLARPRVNLLLETLWSRSGAVTGPGRAASTDTLFLSPGVRFAHDFRSGLQIVPGVAVPIGLGPSRGSDGLFVYLSLEHPFRRAR